MSQAVHDDLHPVVAIAETAGENSMARAEGPRAPELIPATARVTPRKAFGKLVVQEDQYDNYLL